MSKIDKRNSVKSPRSKDRQPYKRRNHTNQGNDIGVFYWNENDVRAKPGGYLYRLDKRKKPVFIPMPPQDFKDGSVIVFNTHSSHSDYLQTYQMIGFVDDPSIFSLMAIYESNIPFEFTNSVKEEAFQVADVPLDLSEGFTDFRHIPLVTIDGEDAKDFDDAVWAEKTQDGYHIIVAIADVSYYVKSGSAIDQEAFLRGNSVYFPDYAVPMLPEVLSNGMCSLKPHEDRASLLVSINITPQGGVENYRFYRALIQSRARLTYHDVEKAIQGKISPDISELWDSTLQPLFEAFQVLRRARETRGALEIRSSETKIIFSDKKDVQQISQKPRYESHQLIEEMMILANVCAAKALQKKKGNKAEGIYRIHDEPQADRIQDLMSFMKRIGINWPKGKNPLHPSPRMFNDLIFQTINTPFERLVNELILRCQSQARYHPKNMGHYGLGLKSYCHFTSPIRRYADLVVHRALVHKFGLGSDDQERDDDLPTQEYLVKTTDWISETERRAANAERSSINRFVALYYKPLVGKEFDCVIVAVHPAGVFVEILESGAQGLIPYEMLGKDYFYLDETNQRYIGKRTKKVFELGQQIKAKLSDVDLITAKLNLMLDQNTQEERSKKVQKKFKRIKKERKRTQYVEQSE